MNRIESLRKERNLSQQQLAEEFHVHQTAVSQWEKGRTMPSFDTIMQLCSFFDVSPDYLMSRSDQRGHFNPTDEETDKLSQYEANEQISAELHARLNTSFSTLNFKGQQKAVETVEIIAGNPEFKK